MRHDDQLLSTIATKSCLPQLCKLCGNFLRVLENNRCSKPVFCNQPDGDYPRANRSYQGFFLLAFGIPFNCCGPERKFNDIPHQLKAELFTQLLDGICLAGALHFRNNPVCLYAVSYILRLLSSQSFLIALNTLQRVQHFHQLPFIIRFPDVVSTSRFARYVDHYLSHMN